MLETKCVGDKFKMLGTDLIHCENDQHNEKKVDNIMILPPTSEISRHHKVTNHKVRKSPT